MASFVCSLQGNPKLVYEGFLYQKISTYSATTYWKCEKNKKCQVRATSTGDPITVTVTGTHNHALPNVEMHKVLAEIRRQAKETRETPEAILTQVLADLTKEVRDALPKRERLRHIILYTRLKENAGVGAIAKLRRGQASSIEEAILRNRRKRKHHDESNDGMSEEVIEVAVLPLTYPKEYFSPAELETLEEAIVDELALGWKDKIVFEGIHAKFGFLVLDCADEDTVKWVELAVPILSNWTGTKITTKRGADIPKPYTINLLLPKSVGQTQEKSLAILEAQNHDLRTKEWRILNVRDEGHCQVLTAVVDRQTMEAISRARNSLRYRFGRIDVYENEGSDFTTMRYDDDSMGTIDFTAAIKTELIDENDESSHFIQNHHMGHNGDDINAME